MFVSLLSFSVVFASINTASSSYAYTPPASGRATLTHYDLPFKYIASCGCVGLSTRHPTAALNSMAYGSTTSYGPSCGICYRLQLESTPLTPPAPDGTGIFFASNDTKAPSIIVKITDDCPLGGDWCTQTNVAPMNRLGSMLHFDLAWPSRAIRDDFFPTDQGRDYGVWWAQYEVVDCIEWSGYNDQEAGGSDWTQQSSACCPLRPSLTNESITLSDEQQQQQQQQQQHHHCPSYSDQIASGLSITDMYAQVPNTANILSKSIDRQVNNAWTYSKPNFPWLWPGFRRIDTATPPSTLQDWQAIGPPPLLR